MFTQFHPDEATGPALRFHEVDKETFAALQAAFPSSLHTNEGTTWISIGAGEVRITWFLDTRSHSVAA